MTIVLQSHLSAVEASEVLAYCMDRRTQHWVSSVIAKKKRKKMMIAQQSLWIFVCYLSMLRVWLCKARKDTGESMASRLLAHSLTTFNPVWWIFSVSWSTAMLLGAHTNTGLEGQTLECCFTYQKMWVNSHNLHAILSQNNSKRTNTYVPYPLPWRAKW